MAIRRKHSRYDHQTDSSELGNFLIGNDKVFVVRKKDIIIHYPVKIRMVRNVNFQVLFHIFQGILYPFQNSGETVHSLNSFEVGIIGIL